MINDILTGLEKISFQGWLAIWLIIALFAILNKLSSWVDIKLELMKAQAERERDEASLARCRRDIEADAAAKANRL